MRKAFADTLIRVAEENPKVAFLTGDLGFQVFDGFRKQFGGRYLNAGIAECIWSAARPAWPTKGGGQLRIQSPLS